MLIVEPTLLKMIGRGFENDPYAHDGIHLRWFAAPSMGFPREPFRLYRREGIDRSLPEQGYQTQDIVATEVNAGDWDVLHMPGYLHVYRESPNTVRVEYLPPALPHGTPGGILVTDVPLYVDFSPPSGPRGASYAEIFVSLGSQGHVTVAAQQFGGPDEWYVVDRQAATFQTHGGYFRLRLRGDRFGRLMVVGADAWISRVVWVLSEQHADAGDWYDVAEFYLPIDDPNGAWYAHWSSDPLGEALSRLLKYPAQAPDPWDEPNIPPAAGPPSDDYYVSCYSAPYEKQLQFWLERVLVESYEKQIPQLTVLDTVDLDPLQNPAGDALPAELAKGGQRATYRPLALLSTALYDPHFARFMGMATVQDDPAPPNHTWDYMITARWDVEELGLEDAEKAALQPFLAKDGHLELASIVHAVQVQSHALPAPPADLRVGLDQQTPPGSGAVAHARLLWQMPPRERPLDPEGIGLLYALTRLDESGDVQILNAIGALTERPVPYLPDDHLLSDAPEKDLPKVENCAVFRDRTVPQEGTYSYKVSGADPFGRWSPWAEAKWTFVDRVAPSAPIHLQATVIDPQDPDVPADAKAWLLGTGEAGYGLRVQFDWPDQAAANAPDLAEFRVHVRQGVVGPSEDGFRDPTHWGLIEYSARSSASVLRFGYWGGDRSILGVWRGQPVKVHTPFDYGEVAGEGEVHWGRRYIVDLSGFDIPLGDNGQGRVSVAITAVDERGNQSNPIAGPAAAIRIDRTPPPSVTLPALDKATYADATGRSTYEVEWTGAAGAGYAVWRGIDNKLSSAATPEQQERLNGATTIEERGAILREIAAGHLDALVRLNQELIPAGRVAAQGEQLVYRDALPGSSRNLYVYAVIGTSVTGVDGAKPTADQLVTVQVPQRRTPGALSWRRLRQTADGDVELQLQMSRGNPVSAVEIYRTVNQQRAQDVRQMLPIRRVSGAELPELSPDEADETPLLVIDDTAKPWRRYYYRAIARAPADDSGVLGARSAATPVATVLTYDPELPPLPTAINVVQSSPDELTLTWSSTVPYGRVAQGLFSFAVLRKGQDEEHFVDLGRFATDESQVAFSSTPPGPTPRDQEIVVEYTYVDEPPGQWAGTDVSYIIRVIDPLGKFVNSRVVTCTFQP